MSKCKKYLIIGCVLLLLSSIPAYVLLNWESAKEVVESVNDHIVESSEESSLIYEEEKDPITAGDIKFDPYDLSAYVYTFYENELTHDRFLYELNIVSNMTSLHVDFTKEETLSLYSDLLSKLPDGYPNTLLFRKNGTSIDVNICEPGNSLTVLHTLSISTNKES